MHATALPQGKYFGEATNICPLPDCLVTFTEHHSLATTAAHSHANPYLCFVVKGGFRETAGRSERDCGVGSAVVHPVQERHFDAFGPDGALCMNIEWTGAETARIANPKHCKHGPLSWAAVRFLRELWASPSDDLTLESLACEMLAVASMSEVQLGSGWALAAQTLLEDSYSEAISLRTLSTSIGLHPVHLARCYRNVYRQSIGEGLRGIRVRRASCALLNSNRSIAEVALDCGFYDQAHLTNAFKRLTGMTPGFFRLVVSSSVKKASNIQEFD